MQHYCRIIPVVSEKIFKVRARGMIVLQTNDQETIIPLPDPTELGINALTELFPGVMPP